MAFSLLWSFGLIISILIFAVAIGFCLGYAGISRKSLAIVSIGSIICTFILVYAINLFKNQLNLVMGAYNYLLLFLIAFVMMFIGYSINKHDEDKRNFTKAISLSENWAAKPSSPCRAASTIMKATAWTRWSFPSA